MKRRLVLALNAEGESGTIDELLDVVVDELRDAIHIMTEIAIESDSWSDEEGNNQSMVQHFGEFSLWLEVVKEEVVQ